MASTLNDLLIEIQELVDKVEQVAFGNEMSEVTYKGVTQSSLTKQLNDKLLIIQSMVQGRKEYQTLDLLVASGAPSADASGNFPLAEVWNDATLLNNGLYGWDGAQWTLSKYGAASNQLVETDKGTGVTGFGISEYIANTIYSGRSRNLINPSHIRRGFYYSPGSNEIKENTSYRMTGFVPVTEGQTYVLSGAQDSLMAYFSSADDSAVVSQVSGASFTVPSGQGIKYVATNITSQGQDVTTYDNSIQLELGSVATEWEAYQELLPLSKLEGGSNLLGIDWLYSNLINNEDGAPKLKPESLPDIASFGKNFIFESGSKNLINPSDIDYVNRYSQGNKNITVDSLGIAATGYIPVDEGEFYAISGLGMYYLSSPQGGYFADNVSKNAISNIEWFDPVIGIGKVFQVPSGLGIKYVVVSLTKKDSNPSSTELYGNAQLEAGELPTDYSPYNIDVKIKKSLMPTLDSANSSAINDSEWYVYLQGEEAANQADKIPVFRRHWLKKDKDLVVVGTGTSLTARSDEHCTAHREAKYRPPLMHSNNFASHLWDKVKWDGQEYRRFDTDYFSETGTFNTSFNLAEWDDGLFRQGWTRYSEDVSSAVLFQIPIAAWQFNFIYRTDSVATDLAQIDIVEGVGKVEVYDEVLSIWVEADGYQFSMKATLPVERTVNVPKPSDDTLVDRTIASSGNTTYQKRLKMRCKSGSIDSRSEAKAVKVTAVNSGRLMYWGVEWSVREFMVTYINAARGSHNTQAESDRGLPRFADNEVWGFKPDLMFFELPIHNDGAAGSGSYSAQFFERLTNNYVFNLDYELSMKTRSSYFGLAPEFAMFTSSIALSFGGINDDGSLKITEQQGGKMMSALDKFSEAHMWVKDNYPDVVCINAAQRWVDAGVAIFGDLKSATVGSGKTGTTFTNEGGHWNNIGSRIIAKVVLPVLNFER